jgi:hypothetical protein
LGIGWFTSFSRRGRFEEKEKKKSGARREREKREGEERGRREREKREGEERGRRESARLSLQPPEAPDLAPVSPREDRGHPQQVGEAPSATPGSADALLEDGDEEVLHRVLGLDVEVSEVDARLTNEPRVQLASDGVQGGAVAVERATNELVEVEGGPCGDGRGRDYVEGNVALAVAVVVHHRDLLCVRTVVDVDASVRGRTSPRPPRA